MPESEKLTQWIAESNSWQSYIDFDIPTGNKVDFSFFEKYDNFYLSLLKRTVELLKEDNSTQLNSQYLAAAKGLEIFSLIKKRNHFIGIDQPDNILFVSSLYYLANFSASAWILSKIYPKNSYSIEIDKFLSSFLTRELSSSDEITLLLKAFLDSGIFEYLDSVQSLLEKGLEVSFYEDINQYFSYLTAKAIVLKFIKENIWTDLLSINNNADHWRDFVIHNINRKVPIWSFFPSQKLAINGGILNGSTCSLQMPTSAGKTSISELIIYDEFKKNSECKILYLAPYRALAAELKQSLAICLAELGVVSKTMYGGNLPTVEERTSINTINLLISTPEKFMAIEDFIPETSQMFTTIICDEGHLLDDSSRGLSYELLLSRLKSDDSKERRFIFISAIIPNIGIVNEWLGGSEDSLISSNYRPTELEYGFLVKVKGTNYALNINPTKDVPQNYNVDGYLSDEELKISIPDGKPKTISSKKGISVAASLKATASGTVALFAPHKRGHSGVEGLAEEALFQISLRDNTLLTKFSPVGHLDILVEYFSAIFGDDYLLTKCSKLGILFHHGDFPQNIREVIEDSIRSNKNRFVICTNTLAEGVNLPIKTMVLHSTQRFNPYVVGNWETLKIRDLKNLVGRAGRAGKETKGLVIIPHADDFGVITDLILDNNIEPVRGQLYNIINLINSYLQRQGLQISAEILDGLSFELQELLDDVDASLIDLLAEDVDPEGLSEIVNELVKQTLSYFQANDREKNTLNTIFGFRTTKLKPIIENGNFATLKNSGTNIRQFEAITEHFDFQNDIWLSEIGPLDEHWLDYILTNGIFSLPSFESILKAFNDTNSANFTREQIREVIILWINGSWYFTIAQQLNHEIYHVLRLINSFIGFNIQTVVGSVIRLKDLTTEQFELPISIATWPNFLQYGVNSQLQLDLIEMGLIDRLAVLAVSNYLLNSNYEYVGYEGLKATMLTSGIEILEDLTPKIPNISSGKLRIFVNGLFNKNIL